MTEPWQPERIEASRVIKQYMEHMSAPEIREKARIRGLLVPSLEQTRLALQSHLIEERVLLNVTQMMFWTDKELNYWVRVLQLHHTMDHFHLAHYVVMVLVQRGLPVTITPQRRLKLKISHQSLQSPPASSAEASLQTA